MQPIPTTPEAPRARQPLAARIVMWLFVIAATLTLITIPLSWILVRDAVNAGEIPADRHIPICTIYTLIGLALMAVYLGTAWAYRTARSWLAAFALSIIALFGWPAGTALGLVSLVVLLTKSVRKNFRA